LARDTRANTFHEGSRMNAMTHSVHDCRVVRLAGALGAEVYGIDLARLSTKQEIDAIKQ